MSAVRDGHSYLAFGQTSSLPPSFLATGFQSSNKSSKKGKEEKESRESVYTGTGARKIL